MTWQLKELKVQNWCKFKAKNSDVQSYNDASPKWRFFFYFESQVDNKNKFLR